MFVRLMLGLVRGAVVYEFDFLSYFNLKSDVSICLMCFNRNFTFAHLKLYFRFNRSIKLKIPNSFLSSVFLAFSYWSHIFKNHFIVTSLETTKFYTTFSLWILSNKIMRQSQNFKELYWYYLYFHICVFYHYGKSKTFVK